MVEFKVVVNDVKNGKSYQIPVSGAHANSLIGKKIGEEVDGIFVSLPGYRLQITGGTDKDGFPMRPDFPGMGKRRLLLSGGVGYNPDRKGKRKKKMVRGNTISADIVQINMKIVKYGSKPIEELLSLVEKRGEEKSEQTSS